MGLFSKRKTQPTAFENIFLANSERIWGWFPGVWYQDLNMVPLVESGLISKKEIEALTENLFPVQGQEGWLVPKDFEAKFDGTEIAGDQHCELREMFAAEFAGTKFYKHDYGALSTQIDDGNSAEPSYTQLYVSFQRDKSGVEFGYVFVNMGFLTWPFSPDYVDLEPDAVGLGSLASWANALSTKVRAPVVLETFMAVSEALVLGAKKNFFKTGRLGIADKAKLEQLPKPKFRVLPNYPLAAVSGSQDWTWGYQPQVLQMGWTFTADTLKDKTGVTILGNAPIVAYQLFAEGCRNWPILMDQVFGAPATWASGPDRGVHHSGELISFMKDQDYNGSPNSLAYSWWLERFSKAKLSMSALEVALSDMSGEEEIIARGNLSLANLMLGKFDEAEKLAKSVLQDDAEDSEAVYVLEQVAQLAKKPELLELAKKARAKRGFLEYSAPSWLVDGISAVGTRGSTRERVSSEKLDKELLEKLTEQFMEFVRVIDKLEFATIEDAEGLRPWVQIASVGEADIVLVIGSPEIVNFKDFPWFEPARIEEDFVDYQLPRSFFVDPAKVSSFLADVFESYNEIEIEIEANGRSVPRLKTLFPVIKRPVKTNPGLAAAASVGAVAAGAAATTYTPRFFFAATTETQSEEPPSFDWF